VIDRMTGVSMRRTRRFAPPCRSGGSRRAFRARPMATSRFAGTAAGCSGGCAVKL